MGGMRYQPQGRASLSREGLGRGVQMLLMPQGGRVVDIVSGKEWTPSGNATTKVTTQGIAASLDGTDGTYFTASGYENIVGNVGTFFIWMPRVGPRDTNGQMFFGTNVGSAVFFQLGVSDDAYVFGGSSVNGSGSSSVYSTRNSALAFVSGGTAGSKRLFINGVSSGTPDGNVPTAFVAGSKTLRFGGWMGGNLWDVDCDTVVAGFTTEVWTEAQARQFYETPWVLFDDQVDEDELLLSSGAAGSTIGASWTEQSESVALVGAAAVATSAAWTETSETIGAAATVSAIAVAAWTETGEAVAAAAIANAAASVGWAEGSDTHSASASVGSSVGLNAAWVEGAETVAVAADTKINAAVGWVEAGETHAALATVRINAAAGWAEQSDTVGLSAQVLASAGPVDVSTISPARIVVFEGSGSRVVPFEGSGSRVVRFE